MKDGCIAELAEEGVYLLPLGMQLGAPILSSRVAKWTDLMLRFGSLQSHISSSTGWKAAEIPQRWGHFDTQSNLLNMPDIMHGLCCQLMKRGNGCHVQDRGHVQAVAWL